MPPISKAKYFILYSLLFISIVCQSFAVFGNNLKKTEPYNLQIAESDNPREVLKKTLSAIQSVKSYRIRIEIPSVSKAVIIREYASPDSVRMFGKNEELIQIGKNAYYKKGDDSWKKYPEQNSQVSMTNLPVTALENFIKMLNAAKDIKLIGQEMMDGIPTLAYQHVFGSGTDPYTMKAWISVADGLPRRCEFECIVAGGSTKSTVIETYYDYNADIKIEAPMEYDLVPFPVEGLAPVVEQYNVLRPPSAGPGESIGVGSGAGTGVGPGRGFNMGGGVGRSDGDNLNPDGSAKSVDSRPQPLNRPRPNHTEEARKNKIQGNVRVRALIDADGSVKQVRIISGLPDGLNEEAILAVKQMRFKPATKNGKPVAYWVPLDVEFNLR
jgi:TonB family protein